MLPKLSAGRRDSGIVETGDLCVWSNPPTVRVGSEELVMRRTLRTISLVMVGAALWVGCEKRDDTPAPPPASPPTTPKPAPTAGVSTGQTSTSSAAATPASGVSH